MRPFKPRRVPLFPGQSIAPDAINRPGNPDLFRAAKAAAESWAAATAMQRPQKKLAPWDEDTYYNAPVITPFTLGLNVDTIIAKSDLYRMVLIFSSQTGASGTILLKPGSAFSLAQNEGIAILGLTLPFILLRDTHKVLVSTEWHAVATANSLQITVTEITLRTMPPPP